MKNKKVKDERIIQVQNKILSETYFIMVLLLFISVLVKAYVLKGNYTNYIAELSAIVLSTIYISIRSIMTGNNLIGATKKNKSIYILGTLATSIIITVINGVKSYTNYSEQYSGLLDAHFLAALAVTFISSLALISIGLLFVYLCHKKGQQRIEKTLEEG